MWELALSISKSDGSRVRIGDADADDRLVNIQAVIADTKRGIAEVRRKIEILLSKDADHRRIVRFNTLPVSDV